MSVMFFKGNKRSVADQLLFSETIAAACRSESRPGEGSGRDLLENLFSNFSKLACHSSSKGADVDLKIT